MSNSRPDKQNVKDYNFLMARLKQQHSTLNNEALTQIMQVGSAPLSTTNQPFQESGRNQKNVTWNQKQSVSVGPSQNEKRSTESLLAMEPNLGLYKESILYQWIQ